MQSFAQEKIIIDNHKIQLEQNQSLKDVLELVSEQFELMLAYPTPLINKLVIGPISYSFSDPEDLLNKLLNNFELDIKKVSPEKYLIRKSLNDQEGNYENRFHGTVTDADSGEPLVYASVYFKNFSNGTLTDSTGKFELVSLSTTDDTIVVSYLAYQDLVILPNQMEMPFDLKLMRDDNIIGNVVVEYIVPPAMVSSDGMALIFSKDLPSSQNLGVNDLMRQLQLLPGVNAHTDDDSALKIRGSNADASRIILDGMPLYNVDHYYGIFSSVNADYVDEVNLYKNAQPICFRSIGGGLVLMNSQHNPHKTSGIIHADLLNTSAAFSSELNDRFSLNLGIRTTYRNVDDGGLINLKRRSNDPENFDNPQKDVFISNEPEFRFYDLNGRINFKVSNKTSVSYSLFKSRDKYLNSYELNFNNHQEQNSKTVFENSEEWDNFSNALIVDSEISQNWHLNGTIHLTDYTQNSELQSELIQNRQGQIERKTIQNYNNSAIRDLGIKLYASSEFNRHNFIVGAEINNYMTKNLLESEDLTLIDQDFSAELYDLFFGYSWTKGPFILQLGNRGHYYLHKHYNSVRLSPQLSGSLLIKDVSTLKFSISRSHQFLRELEYETRQSYTTEIYTLSNMSIPVLRTDNFMLGCSYQISGWGLDIEAFYKDIDGALQLTNNLPGIQTSGHGMQDFKLFHGDRKVIGMDMMLSFTNNKYSSWLAYTLSKSTDEYKAIFKGESFSSEDDRRHQLKLINSLDIGHFTISNTMIYASGKNYLSLESIMDIVQDRSQLDPSEHIKSLPAYFRIDLGLDYNFSISGIKSSFGISAFNILNRQNVKYVQYAYRLDGQNAGSTILGSEAELLDRTINVNFTLEF